MLTEEELLELVESTSEEEEEVGDGENKEKQQKGLTLESLAAVM